MIKLMHSHRCPSRSLQEITCSRLLSQRKQRLIKLTTPPKARSSQSVSLIQPLRAGRRLAVSLPLPVLTLERSSNSSRRRRPRVNQVSSTLLVRLDESLEHPSIHYGRHGSRCLASGMITSIMPPVAADHFPWITPAFTSITFLK